MRLPIVNFLRSQTARTRAAIACAVVAAGLTFGATASAQTVSLLNDTWADGDRTSVNLPSNSPTWIGQSAGNGSNSVTPGALNFTLPTNSLKVWSYFTRDNSEPDGNQPHNSVTQIGVGDKLIASMTFNLPDGATAASTSKNFRVGLFFDPTDARVRSDTNSDGGGTTSPWQDGLGYLVQLPLNGTSSGNNPLQIGKRTTSNTSLAGSSGAYTFAPTGGSSFALAGNTSYTAELILDMISATQTDVTARILDGTGAVISSLTVADTGTAFGGTAIPGGLLPGSQSVYTNFDQLFFRNSDNTQATRLTFTNWKVDLVTIPEPSTAVLGGLVLIGLARVRRRR